MAVDYSNVDTEVLGQMMRVAKQSQGVPVGQLVALQKAVAERKQQLNDKLSALSQQVYSDEVKQLNLNVCKELITLEPDQYKYYQQAGWWCHTLADEKGAIAYYTAALQLADND